MSDQVAATFIEALQTLEETKNVEPLAGLYAKTAAVGNIIAPDHSHGPDGARKFWTEYRGTFDQARSKFRSIVVSEGRAALEWTTTGTSFSGAPFSYSGVTILEITDGKITRSAAYFDPAALGRQIGAV